MSKQTLLNKINQAYTNLDQIDNDYNLPIANNKTINMMGKPDSKLMEHGIGEVTGSIFATLSEVLAQGISGTLEINTYVGPITVTIEDGMITDIVDDQTGDGTTSTVGELYVDINNGVLVFDRETV